MGRRHGYLIVRFIVAPALSLENFSESITANFMLYWAIGDIGNHLNPSNEHSLYIEAAKSCIVDGTSPGFLPINTSSISVLSSRTTRSSRRPSQKTSWTGEYTVADEGAVMSALRAALLGEKLKQLPNGVYSYLIADFLRKRAFLQWLSTSH